jgi:Ca2+/Na+ antiporter
MSLTTYRRSMLVAMFMFLGATVLSLPAIESRLGFVAHLGQVIFYVAAFVYLVRGLIGMGKEKKRS